MRKVLKLKIRGNAHAQHLKTVYVFEAKRMYNLKSKRPVIQ